MKKIVIIFATTVTIIITSVTTMVGYHEYSDWKNEKDSIASHECQKEIAIESIKNWRKHCISTPSRVMKDYYLDLRDDAIHNKCEHERSINYYTIKSETGFWRCIFNSCF
jgi:hypothetical protein